MGLFDSKADLLNEMAAEFIEEGNELKEEYKSLSAKAEKKSKKIEASFRAEAEYKSQILNELGHDITFSLEHFQKLDIDNRILDTLSPPSIDTEKSFGGNILESINVNENVGRAGFGVVSDYTSLGLVGIITKLIHNAEAEDKAYHNHQNARKYMYAMDKAVEQVKNVLIGMDAVEKLIEDEHDTIEKLMTKVRKLKSTLDISVKSVYSKQEADYLKSLYAIAKKIKESLDKKIVDDKGKITDGYNKYCEDLKNINNGLPSMPKLNDAKTERWLELIAESVIVN